MFINSRTICKFTWSPFKIQNFRTSYLGRLLIWLELSELISLFTWGMFNVYVLLKEIPSCSLIIILFALYVQIRTGWNGYSIYIITVWVEILEEFSTFWPLILFTTQIRSILILKSNGFKFWVLGLLAFNYFIKCMWNGTKKKLINGWSILKRQEQDVMLFLNKGYLPYIRFFYLSEEKHFKSPFTYWINIKYKN